MTDQTCESYQLVLRHCIENENEIIPLDDTLAIKYVIQSNTDIDLVYVIDKMFEEMKKEALRRINNQ